MWDCEKCGTLQIAASIEACPVCQTPRPSQNVAEEPAATPAPEGGTDEPDSDGPFPADDEGEASPPHDEEPEQEEDDGTDHSE